MVAPGIAGVHRNLYEVLGVARDAASECCLSPFGGGLGSRGCQLVRDSRGLPQTGRAAPSRQGPPRPALGVLLNRRRSESSLAGPRWRSRGVRGAAGCLRHPVQCTLLQRGSTEKDGPCCAPPQKSFCLRWRCDSATTRPGRQMCPQMCSVCTWDMLDQRLKPVAFSLRSGMGSEPAQSTPRL